MPYFDPEPAKRDIEHQTDEKQFSTREKSLKKSGKVQLQAKKQTKTTKSRRISCTAAAKCASA